MMMMMMMIIIIIIIINITISKIMALTGEIPTFCNPLTVPRLSQIICTLTGSGAVGLIE